MHLDFGKVIEDRRRIDERRPVVLDVLPGGEMPVTLVEFFRDQRELSHLL